MKAAYAETNKQSSAFTIMGAKSVLSAARSNKPETSLLTSSEPDYTLDTCTFANLFSEPSDSDLMTFGEQQEAASLVSYNTGESTGSIAYSGSESCGSIAAGFSCDSSSSFGGCCSYSC